MTDLDAPLNGDDLQSFDRPSMTIDLVLFTVRHARIQVLLMRREHAPHAGDWVVPGGFVRIDEALGQAARRVLRDKAQLSDAFIEQLYTFGAVDRDPRGRVITVAYYALVDSRQIDAAMQASGDLLLADVIVPWAGDEGGEVAVCDEDGQVLTLGFDHAEIVAMAVKRLRGKLDYSPVGFELLPDRFTLRQLQEVHEAILGTTLNKPAFRRRILDKGVLQATGERESGVTYRPAELYRFRDRSDGGMSKEEG